MQARRREAFGMTHHCLLALRLAHLCAVGVKSPMGGPWAWPPRRRWSRAPLDLFYLHLCTVQHTTTPNKVPHLHRDLSGCQITPNPTLRTVQLRMTLSPISRKYGLPAARSPRKVVYKSYPRCDSGAFVSSEASLGEESINLLLSDRRMFVL